MVMSKRTVSDIDFHTTLKGNSISREPETMDSHAKVCPKGRGLYDLGRPSLEQMVNTEKEPDLRLGCEAFAL